MYVTNETNLIKRKRRSRIGYFFHSLTVLLTFLNNYKNKPDYDRLLKKLPQ